MRSSLRRTSCVVIAVLGVATTPVVAARAGQKTAQHFGGVARVGALFVPGAYPSLHTCTASVVSTRSRDVIMTAAHCITGTGVGYRFVPGYRNGQAPYGVWSVVAAYAAPGWIQRQDPREDYAFLTIAKQSINGHTRRIQRITGGYPLGNTAQRGNEVTVIGYAAGANDEALRCTTRVYIHATYPAFDCGGFPGGTSGSPWLHTTSRGPVIAGDIGGLHQGGCTPATSYSPPLGRPARHALARAVSHATGDVFPAPGSDGCT